jgi:hypothetical protein
MRAACCSPRGTGHHSTEPTHEAKAAPAPREVKHPRLWASRLPALRGVDDGPAEHAAETAAARLRHDDAEMTLGVYSHVAKEDDIRVAAQLGEILDPSGLLLKNKGPVPGGQALVN